MKASERRRRIPLSDLTNISSSSSGFNKCTTTTSTTIDLNLNVSDPNSAFHSRKHTPRQNDKNNKRKPLFKLSTIPEQGEGFEDLDLPQAKQSTVPSRKKQCAVSYKQNKSKDAQLQDFIEKQNAYFKEIDEFILSEEEVETLDELD